MEHKRCVKGPWLACSVANKSQFQNPHTDSLNSFQAWLYTSRGIWPAHQPSVTLSVLAQKLGNVLLWKCHLGFLTFEFFPELHFEVACLEEWADKGDILFPVETDECNYLSRHTSFFHFFPFETLSSNMGNYKQNQFAKWSLWVSRQKHFQWKADVESAVALYLVSVPIEHWLHHPNISIVTLTDIKDLRQEENNF